MNKSQIFVRLRIAATAVCLVLCAIAVAMWIRSYFYFDLLSTKTSWKSLRLESQYGRLRFDETDVRRVWVQRLPSRETIDLFLSEITRATGNWRLPQNRVAPSDVKTGVLGFEWIVENPNSATSKLFVPYWFIVFLLGAFAAAPWLHLCKRFGLRFLFIITTFLALYLGLVVLEWRQ